MWKRCPWPVAVFAAVCGVAVGADEGSGRSPGLVRISVGYAKTIRAEKWFPIWVVVENPGPATDVEVVVSGEEADGSRAFLLSRASLRLPARSTRWHIVYADAERADRVSVELYEHGRRMARELVEQSATGPRDTMILGLSTMGRGFNCYQPSVSQWPGPRLRFNNTAQFWDLPSRWPGLEPVEVLVLGPLPPEGVSVMQERAIVDWVHSGGLLILCPGGAPPNYGPAIESLSPVQILGGRLVEDLPSLAQWYGALPGGSDRIGLTEAVMRDGRPFINCQFPIANSQLPMPLVASRHEGAGTVVFVAFDLSHERILQWRPLQRLYHDLIELRGSLPKAPDTRLPREAAEALGEAIGVPVLPRWALTACLTANLGMVAVLLFGLRRRREMAFVALVVCAPCAALVINAIGAAATGVAETTLASLHVVRSAAGGRECGVTSYYALLSPGAGQCDVRFPGTPSAFPRGLPLPLARGARHAAAESVRTPMEFMDEDVKWLRQLRVLPRVASMFQSAGAAGLPVLIEAAATVQADGIRFEIVNKSDRKFSDGLVACNRNAVGIGDLAPGAKATAWLNSGTAQGLMTGLSIGAFRSKEGTLHDRIVRSLYAARRSADLFDTGAVVFGWVDQQPVAVEIAGLSQTPKVSAAALWVVSPALRGGGEGRILLPKGTPAMQFPEPITPTLMDGLWRPIHNGWNLDIAYAAPAEVRGMKAERIDFFLRTGRVPTAKTVMAFNVETGEYDRIVAEEVTDVPAVPVLTQPGRFSLPNPEKYLSPLTGKVLLRVRLEPQVPLSMAAMVRAPMIEDLDLEIEGIRR